MFNLGKAVTLFLLAVGLIGCSMNGSEPLEFPAPDRPDGPSACKVGQKVEFETKGTDPLDVHEFQWDFGDGYVSDPVAIYQDAENQYWDVDNQIWLHPLGGDKVSDWDDDAETVTHRFGRAGRFEVRVRERCPLGLFESDWSKEHKIVVK